jgi:hypothetical protein
MEMNNKKHSDFSPSSMERLVNCPGSWRACKTVDDQTQSKYASDGTLAHEVLEYVLKLKFGQDLPNIDLTADKYNDEVIEYAEQTCAAIEAELQHIETEVGRKHGGVESTSIHIEETVYASNLEFGTPDFRSDITFKDGFKLRLIVDYKYGYNEVPVDGNKQLFAYSLFADLQAVKQGGKRADYHWFVINQPNLNKWAVAEYTSSDMSLFLALYEKTKEACYDGTLFKAGEHCTYCTYKPKCVEYTSKYGQLIQDRNLELPSISEDKIWDAFLARKQVRQLLDSIEDYCYKEAMKGNAPETVKLVRISGRRSWNNEVSVDKVANTLKELGCEEPTKTVLKGITEVERKLKQKVPDELVSKSESKLALVDESDKREAVDPTASLIELFD